MIVYDKSEQFDITSNNLKYANNDNNNNVIVCINRMHYEYYFILYYICNFRILFYISFQINCALKMVV